MFLLLLCLRRQRYQVSSPPSENVETGVGASFFRKTLQSSFRRRVVATSPFFMGDGKWGNRVSGVDTLDCVKGSAFRFPNPGYGHRQVQRYGESHINVHRKSQMRLNSICSLFLKFLAECNLLLHCVKKKKCSRKKEKRDSENFPCIAAALKTPLSFSPLSFTSFPPSQQSKEADIGRLSSDGRGAFV